MFGKEGTKTNRGNIKKIFPKFINLDPGDALGNPQMDELPWPMRAGGPSGISSLPHEATFPCTLEIQHAKGQERRNRQLCTASLCPTLQLCLLPRQPSPTKEQISLPGRISTSQVLEGNSRHKGSQKLCYLPSHAFPHRRLFTWASFICTPLLPASTFSNKQIPNQ